MQKLTNYINGFSKDSQLKTEIGVIGLSPSNIESCAKFVDFVVIRPERMFSLATKDAPSFVDNSLWYQPQPQYSRDLLQQCIAAAEKKKKRLPIVVEGECFKTRQSVEELLNFGVKSISTNPTEIVIARFCAAQALIAMKPPSDADGEDDDDDQIEE